MVSTGSDSVKLEQGSAAWVSADDGPFRVVAEVPTALFRSTVGIPPVRTTIATTMASTMASTTASTTALTAAAVRPVESPL